MKDQPIQLSRGHLFALGAMSVALAVLTFFLGFTVAERRRPTTDLPPELTPLTAEEVRAGTLESLLARVADEQRADLAFPGELERAGNVSEGGIPTGGWAIQVAEYPDTESAERLVAELRAAELPAYRAAALVDGRKVQRVRVSGFGTRDAALRELESVASRTGASAPVVVPAP